MAASTCSPITASASTWTGPTASTWTLPDYASQLGVVWYVTDVSRPLLELGHDAVHGLDWERLVEDYDITLM
jgi:hypothetical protein